MWAARVDNHWALNGGPFTFPVNIRVTSVRNDTVRDVLQSEYGGQVMTYIRLRLTPQQLPPRVPRLSAGPVRRSAATKSSPKSNSPHQAAHLNAVVAHGCMVLADTWPFAQGRAQFPSHSSIPRSVDGTTGASVNLYAATAAAGRRMLTSLG